jgi:hypothetical protein
MVWTSKEMLEINLTASKSLSDFAGAGYTV